MRARAAAPTRAKDLATRCGLSCLALAAGLLVSGGAPAIQEAKPTKQESHSSEQKGRPGFLGMAFTYHREGAPARSKGFLFVRAVVSGAPAEKAGLRAQDIVTAIDGKPVEFEDDLEALEFFETVRPGQEVTFAVRRGTTSTSVKLVAARMSTEQYERWRLNLKMAREARRKAGRK